MFNGDNVPLTRRRHQGRYPESASAWSQTLMDSFSAALSGIQYWRPGAAGLESFTDSELRKLEMIKDCYPAPEAASWWNKEKDGIWTRARRSHRLDRRRATRCARSGRLRRVAGLRTPAAADLGGASARRTLDSTPRAGSGSPSASAPGQVGRHRTPRSSATTRARSLRAGDVHSSRPRRRGTSSDNFRRGRSGFSLVGASDRSFSRYNEKLVGFAGGNGLLQLLVQAPRERHRYSFNQLWPYLIDRTLPPRDRASVVFRLLTRQLSRPQSERLLQAGRVRRPRAASAADAFSKASEVTR